MDKESIWNDICPKCGRKSKDFIRIPETMVYDIVKGKRVYEVYTPARMLYKCNTCNIDWRG